MPAEQLQLKDLRGLGKARLEALATAGIRTVADLLMDVPVSYRDTSLVTPIADLSEGQTACVAGTLVQIRTRYIGKLNIVQGFVRDDTGGLGLVWFNQPWTGKQLRKGDQLLLYGQVTRYKDTLSLQQPTRVMHRGILPMYRRIEGVPNKVREDCVKQALNGVSIICPETLPEALLRRHRLMGLPDALRVAHAPDNDEQLRAARRAAAHRCLAREQPAMRPA
ncbi:MAG: hypothetical protein GX810_09955, partial [Clostridiales bacterium]|nr:hypothetical protein [Clostridiales bacterium]